MRTIRDYAVLAKEAYSTAPTIGSETSAARAIVTDGTIVSFPGTNNVACFLADLEAFTVPVTGYGRVHEGFWNAFNEIKPQLLLLSPEILVGHSEGADLAILYGAALCLAQKPPKAIFGFEPARVSTDNTLADLFVANNVLVTLTRNGEDVIPMVPRLYEDWQHPASLTSIGTPSEPWPNISDHYIDAVIAALI